MVEVDGSIGGARVCRILYRVFATRPLPETLILDNGPEFAGTALDAWAAQHRGHLHFIQPGKPVHATLRGRESLIRHRSGQLQWMEQWCLGDWSGWVGTVDDSEGIFMMASWAIYLPAVGWTQGAREFTTYARRLS